MNREFRVTGFDRHPGRVQALREDGPVTLEIKREIPWVMKRRSTEIRFAKKPYPRVTTADLLGDMPGAADRRNRWQIAPNPVAIEFSCLS